MSTSVLLDVKQGVATLTLNEPDSLNALSQSLASALKQAIQTVKEDAGIKAVVLTGNGHAFCAGGNIKEFPNDSNINELKGHIQETIHLVKELSQLEKPVIAAVNGYCVGAGFSLALACDLVLATSNAKFALGFHKIGLVPDLGALYHLPRVVGMARAKELAFTTRQLSVEEAKEYGIVLDIVEADNLLTRAQALGEQIAQSATLALSLAKSVLNHSYESSLDAILQEEVFVQTLAFSSRDHKEGVQAFLEKRKPVFSGK